ncbi:MAG: histidine triad nucleotide-binding protein [bacterium]|nr:histidine triad nucleotide-binding protein [bacterium]
MACLFCQIAKKEIPATIVWENDEFLAFSDIHPKAPVHVLLIPRKHVESLATVTSVDEPMLGKLMLHVGDVAAVVGLKERGFRTALNTGKEGGQEVPHLHVHIMGGARPNKNG